MPTYQYACTSCGHQLEAVQSFADEPLTECPTCEGRLRKLFSGVGVVFKGSGFYRTDSRSDARSGSSSNGSSNGSGKPAKSSESKPSDSKPSDSKSSDSKASGSKASPSNTSSTPA
ncbi:MAG TPA: FmdB family zinc ribbon protein [Candidatus Limnocylindrales bacterium]